MNADARFKNLRTSVQKLVSADAGCSASANAEKLKNMSQVVQIGGKGSTRRKKKVVHREATAEKSVHAKLKKIGLTSLPDVEEVSIYKTDGKVMYFRQPDIQLSLLNHTTVIHGRPIEYYPEKKVSDGKAETEKKDEVAGKNGADGKVANDASKKIEEAKVGTQEPKPEGNDGASAAIPDPFEEIENADEQPWQKVQSKSGMRKKRYDY